ncbi:hypothetical protein HYC85_011685 [Camellia sinensis]|uniref:Uncharacterized protein n=1 Tax=Camellia sinensis TaxID=4442 RepID=A0A7J7H9R1_CAMSI|nr:hypothetical protein HYC85_011685 [Camellia sinensis]
MATADDHHHHHKARSDGTLWWLCQFWKSGIASSSSSSSIQNSIHQNGGVASNPRSSSSNRVFSAASFKLLRQRAVTCDHLEVSLLLVKALLQPFDERKDQVTVEQVLHAVFLDVEQSSPALEKLKRQLAEAEAAQEGHKKPLADTGPRVVGEGLVIDEWKERREKYLARQQVEAVDSV